MTKTTFRPTLYLLDGCPFCFKVRVFLLEAGLTESVDIRPFAQGTELDAVRAELAVHLPKVSFPAAELEPNRFMADSDAIIGFLAELHNRDTTTMTNLRLYADGPLARLVGLFQENTALKASNPAAAAS